MAENPDESEVFEITDFTTSTEWERFVARLEEILHEWKLHGDSCRPWRKFAPHAFTNGSWREKTEELTFAGFKFIMTHHFLSNPETEEGVTEFEAEDADSNEVLLGHLTEETMSQGNDFPSRSHPLARWFGCGDFLTLRPGSDDILTSESKIKLVLSSACIALKNCNCYVPVFVQAQHGWQSFFLGVREVGSFRTMFDMVHLRYGPPLCQNLSGLLNLFKGKLACMSTSERAIVTTRFNYVLNDWADLEWSQELPSLDDPFLDVLTCRLETLPFGSSSDPINELNLGATWPSMAEDTVVESQHYSDLDPLQAPKWSIRVRMTEKMECLLAGYAVDFLSACRERQSLRDVVGRDLGDFNSSDDEGPRIAGALERLTEPVPSFSTVLESTGKLRKSASPLSLLGSRSGDPVPGSIMQRILLFLFPDIEKDSSAKHYPLEYSIPAEGGILLSDPIKSKLRGCKTAPEDCIVWRLATVMAHSLSSLGGVPAAAHIWHSFILELRFRWENSIMVPGVETGHPNMAYCLLYQKLQMLNCCIERKSQRMKDASRSKAAGDAPITLKSSGLDEGNDAEDDEFYECEYDDEERQADVSKDQNVFHHEPWNQPDGRLRRCGKLTLLNSDEPLYIPITQEPSPLTEDMLEEQAEVLIQLGADSQGTELRARMQSACLLSDMEAFKAANPDARLEDFVRWYSPKDWILEPGEPEWSKEGELSARMKIPDNTWQKIWQSSKPVPARRQRRLFDDTKEAEKVLHFLANVNSDLGSVASLLLSTFLHCSLAKLSFEMKAIKLDLPNVSSIMEEVVRRFVLFSRASKLDLGKCEDIVHLIKLLETVLARAHSLRRKFEDVLPEEKEPVEKDESEESEDNEESDASEPESEEEEKVDVEGEMMKNFVTKLMESPEVEVPGGPNGKVGVVIKRMFNSAEKASSAAGSYATEAERNASQILFPAPVSKEYILRAVTTRPTPYSSPTPQRMYAYVAKNEVRIAGSFMEDTRY